MLTAQWPLAGNTTEKLLLAADAVREKIKAADLAGGKETPKLSPEEQELAEEMAAQASPNPGGDEEQVKPGEPRFLFVTRLSPQDRQAALADAFAKAKLQAAELAKAAGAGLGPLTGISGEAGGSTGGFNPYQRYNNYNRGEYEFVQQVAQAASPEEQQGEALAPRPDGLGFASWSARPTPLNRQSRKNSRWQNRASAEIENAHKYVQIAQMLVFRLAAFC